MPSIKIEKPSRETLSKLHVFDWDIWTCEPSSFDWTYEEQEICYFLEGEVTVVSDDGASVRFGKGDLVTFPSGLKCRWEVKQPVRKHYCFRSV